MSATGIRVSLRQKQDYQFDIDFGPGIPGLVGDEPAAKLEHLDRVLAQFESYCTVTQSVGQGIAIEPEVHDVLGQRLK